MPIRRHLWRFATGLVLLILCGIAKQYTAHPPSIVQGAALAIVPAAPECEYAGRVLDESGEPIGYAVVRLLTQGASPSVVTDAGGFYLIRGKVPSGITVRISIDAPGFVHFDRILADSSQRSIEDIRLNRVRSPSALPVDATKRQFGIHQPRFTLPARNPEVPPQSIVEPAVYSANGTNFFAKTAPIAIETKLKPPIHSAAAAQQAEQPRNTQTAPIRVTVNPDAPTPEAKDVLQRLAKLLPQAGFEILDEKQAELVLECKRCEPGDTTISLRLATLRSPIREVWAHMVTKAFRNGKWRLDVGDAATVFYVSIKAQVGSKVEAQFAESIEGAGSSFEAPMIDEWIDQFRQVKPDARLVFQATGSLEGIRRLGVGETDWAGSDKPLNKRELLALRRPVIQVATLAGAVVPIYSIPELDDPIRFTPEVLAQVFDGIIRNWDDPAIRRDNPGINLPGERIRIVHRADGSGTTYIFTGFLQAVGFKGGHDFTVRWPRGSLSARGNEGVARKVKETAYSIGYVEYLYALRNGLAYGLVRNRAGRFIHADVESIGVAVQEMAGLTEDPEELSAGLVTARNPSAYPVASLSWIIVPTHIADEQTRRTLVAFLRYALTSGQPLATGMGYVSLPSNLARRALSLLDEVERN